MPPDVKSLDQDSEDRHGRRPSEPLVASVMPDVAVVLGMIGRLLTTERRGDNPETDRPSLES